MNSGINKSCNDNFILRRLQRKRGKVNVETVSGRDFYLIDLQAWLLRILPDRKCVIFSCRCSFLIGETKWFCLDIKALLDDEKIMSVHADATFLKFLCAIFKISVTHICNVKGQNSIELLITFLHLPFSCVKFELCWLLNVLVRD